MSGFQPVSDPLSMDPPAVNPARLVILLTGISGYVGGLLIPLLERWPVALRCLARTPDKVASCLATTNIGRAATKAGVRRIICLVGLGDAGPRLSPNEFGASGHPIIYRRQSEGFLDSRIWPEGEPPATPTISAPSKASY
jgi:hypothetical protein